jgi:hypothetical protein
VTRVVLIVVLCFSLLGPFSDPSNSTCSAATLLHDESSQGDFPSFPPSFPTAPPPDLALPLGESTVQGALVAPETPNDTEDWFVFQVSEDMRLENVAFVFDESRLPDLFGRLPNDRYRLYLFEDGTERLVLEFIIVGVDSNSVAPTELPLDDGQPPAGKLAEGLYGMRFNVDQPAPNGVPYVLTFQVTAIPEPAASGLFVGICLGALALHRRRVPLKQ